MVVKEPSPFAILKQAGLEIIRNDQENGSLDFEFATRLLEVCFVLRQRASRQRNREYWDCLRLAINLMKGLSKVHLFRFYERVANHDFYHD